MSRFFFNPKGSSIILNAFFYHHGVQKIVRLVLDTGATYLTITPEIAKSLSLEQEESSEKSEMVNICGVEPVNLVNIDLVRLGNREAKEVKIVVHPLPPESYADGLLGLSFLRNFDLEINFKEGWLEIR